MNAAQYSPIAQKAPTTLATLASATAVCLSVLAGWQRGGWIAERVLWIAIGVVLVLTAHLLPALLRRQPWPLLMPGALLWAASMAAACYGHAVFFTLAQRHAAEARAERAAQTPPISPSSTPTASRSLTEIARDRAAAVARLAEAKARRCPTSCAALDARRTALAARVDALDTEASEAHRQQAAQDRAEAELNAARADPVTMPLAALLGIPAARLDLLSGLAFAAVLEGVACFCWLLALQGSPQHAATPEAVTGPGNAVSNDPRTDPVTAPPAPAVAPVTALAAAEPDRPLGTNPDIGRVTQAIAAGELRATVAGIRRYLGCSQTRAVELRRLLNNEGGIA
ncbi:hypothetical protein [Paraburkholderia adhaesiva]|uniref:hypothetical protein n=1 Tax=Paraburkholderia adhaesiva TaxID=2883244 RepID=UPI001F2FECB5|nr:hypothetical protein [Paraburkholderia adhaesiva]